MELDWIIWLQAAGGWWGRWVMVAITVLGSEEFLFLAVVICFWKGARSLGFRLALLLSVSGFLNAELKELFRRPRPLQILPEVQLVYTQGWSFPSGHAQNSAALGWYWGWRCRGLKRLVLFLLVLLIGLSRVYLGVHYPTDVLAGWVIGAVLVATMCGVEVPLDGRLVRSGSETFFGVIVAACVGLGLLLPHAAAPRLLGLLAGIILGWRRSLPAIQELGSRWPVAGGLVTFTTYVSAKWLLPLWLAGLWQSATSLVVFALLGLLLVRLSPATPGTSPPPP